MRRRLEAIRGRGGRVVVVDPRRTETAEAADEHVAIRPVGDALLLAALLHVIFAEGWVRFGRLEGHVKNVDRLAAFVGELSPERVAEKTGVAPETTRRLAADFAHARRAACYGRVGICTQRYGTLASWLLQALNLTTGRVDEIGGTMLPTPAVDAVGMLSVPCGDGRNPSPSGEERGVVVWSRAAVSPWSAHENGPQSPPGLDPEIPEARVGWRGGSSCARSDPPDSDGARVGDSVGKGGTRPRPRVCVVSPESGREHDRPMAEGRQLAGAPSGVSALEESFLGKTFLGSRLFGRLVWNDHGRDDSRVHPGSRRRADPRRQSISN